MATFPFELLTPERTLLEGEAEMVALRSAEGDIAFLAGHVPYIGAVRPCVVAIHHGGDAATEEAAVHGGFVEVAGDRLVLLAGVAELASEIDVPRAERALRDAESSGDEAAMLRAEVRLQLAGTRARPGAGSGAGAPR